MSTLQARHYVATPSDIKAIATRLVEAWDAQTDAKGDYLKALIATTQAELGSPPRDRTARAATLSLEDRGAHLAALESVHDRFYKAVIDALALEAANNKERNRRATFARTAASTARQWIRSGGDIRALAAGRVTKASLHVESKRTRKSVPLAKRAMRLARRVINAAQEIAKRDKEGARELLEAAMTHIAAHLVASGAAEPTSKIETAEKQHRPFRTKEGAVFWPAAVETETPTLQ